MFAKLNPGVRYVQGMNELIGTLYFVLATQSPTPPAPVAATTSSSSSCASEDGATAEEGGGGAEAAAAPADGSGSSSSSSGSSGSSGSSSSSSGREGGEEAKEEPKAATNNNSSSSSSSSRGKSKAGAGLWELFPAEEVEADAFACFSSLMGELRDVFVEDLDDSSTGIKGRMAAMNVLLERHDVR